MSFQHIKTRIHSLFDTLIETCQETSNDTHLPLYSSVDIRVNNVKAAVVDNNLFPAGFNNLCKFSYENIPNIFQRIIRHKHPHCTRILILAESHTRNMHYWDNVLSLKSFLEDGQFNVDVAALLPTTDSEACINGKISFQIAQGNHIDVYNFRTLKKNLPHHDYDFVLLNNDLIHGVPDELKSLNIPVYPSYAAGWHSRNKSHHFKEVNRIMTDLCNRFDIDPFYTSTAFKEFANCDINNAADRNHLYELSKELFAEIETAYRSHHVDQKPHLFLKANSGSYGMGVVAIESPADILEFNRKIRNRLSKGKESHRIDNFMLQEGVPSDLTIKNNVAELCLYHAKSHYLGGFYRINSQKTNRDNLNSRGMSFQKMCINENAQCPFSTNKKHCDEHVIDNLLFYRFLGLVSVFAAEQEITQLEKTCP